MKGSLLHRFGAWLRDTSIAKLVSRGLFFACFLCTPAVAEDQTDLTQFVRNAISSSSEVLAAEAALHAETERRMGTQRSFDNPELFIDLEEVDSLDRGGERRTVIGVTKRFDLHGKRKARITVAETNELIARAELDGVRTDVALDLLMALARWQSASNVVGLLTTHEHTMANFVLLSERQRNAGDISQMGVDLAKLAWAKTNMSLAAAQVERSTAAEGVRYRSQVSNEREWPAFEFELPQIGTTVESRVSSLPDVRAALLKAQVAVEHVGVVRRNLRPDPTVTLGFGEEAGERLAEIGVSVPLNVLDRGTNSLSAAMADATAATRTGEDITRRARVRLEASAARYRVAHRTWQEWLQEGARSLEDREKLAKRAWEAGELEPADYLVHLDAAIELRAHAIDLRQAAWIAWFEWLAASQNLDGWLGINSLDERS